MLIYSSYFYGVIYRRIFIPTRLVRCRKAEWIMDCDISPASRNHIVVSNMKVAIYLTRLIHRLTPTHEPPKRFKKPFLHLADRRNGKLPPKLSGRWNSLHFSFALSRKYKSSIYYHSYFMSESPRRFLLQQPFTAYGAADVRAIWVVARADNPSRTDDYGVQIHCFTAKLYRLSSRRDDPLPSCSVTVLFATVFWIASEKRFRRDSATKTLQYHPGHLKPL